MIKITESKKKKKSIHRLDMSSSTGPRGAAAPLAPRPPPLATALMSFIPVTNVICKALILKGEI